VGRLLRPARRRVADGRGSARSWHYDKSKATAASLIQTIIDNGLVPAYSEEQLVHVAKCLLGVATVRNKEAGHGSGPGARVVPTHVAAYSLHLAASNIVFLFECHRSNWTDGDGTR
jgi:hypothetical protein